MQSLEVFVPYTLSEHLHQTIRGDCKACRLARSRQVRQGGLLILCPPLSVPPSDSSDETTLVGLTIDEDDVYLLVAPPSVGKVCDDPLYVLGGWGDEVDDRQTRLSATGRLQRLNHCRDQRDIMGSAFEVRHEHDGWAASLRRS